MNTELVDVSKLSYDEIAALTGANVRFTGLPQLRINRDNEDDEGNAVTPGTFYVSQNETSVYSKTAVFRPFINGYRYSVYDSKTNKFINKSVIIKNFFEDALDELGGLRCGKVSKKDFAFLTESEQLKQKEIKCYRLMYGLVSFPGNELVQELPVLWSMSGDNFNSPKMALDTMEKIKHAYFQHNLNLSLERKKQGSNVYYVANVVANIREDVEFTQDNMLTFKMFQDTIDRENSFIINKWSQMKKYEVNNNDEIMKRLDFDDDVVIGE